MIRPGLHVIVEYDSEAGSRQGIRVSEGEQSLVLGDMLTPDVQNYLSAEIKDTYTSWRKEPADSANWGNSSEHKKPVETSFVK